MHIDEWADVTFESFNQCGGSCPACNLTLEERNSEQFHLKEIKEAVKHLKEKNWKPTQRLIFTYGDYPLLKDLEELSDFMRQEDVAFGFTGTFVMPSDHYDHFFKIQDKLGYNLLDIVVDPFRVMHFPHYVANLQRVIKEVPAEKIHFNTLLSRSVLEKFSPEDFADLMVKHFGDLIIAPNALPTLFAINSKHTTKFNIEDALDWLKRYYQKHPSGKLHLKNEVFENYQSEGSFEDCLQHIYHLDSKLNIYAVSDTVMGDFVYDKKNDYKELGNLLTINSWDELINSQPVRKLSVISSLKVDSNEDCETCCFQQSCKFFGIGNVMKSYSQYSNKSTYCYGPKFFELERSTKV